MAKANLPILPFPADIDRETFGHYVSGFTDGEGSFQLRLSNSKTSPSAAFIIGLRSDDSAILHLIRSFFGCGQLYFKPGRGTQKDQLFYQVFRLPDLVSTIIPHFDRFSLHAKKQRDFAVWKEAVLLLDRVTSIPMVSLGGKYGSLPRWTPPRLESFRLLKCALETIREFRPFVAS